MLLHFFNLSSRSARESSSCLRWRWNRGHECLLDEYGGEASARHLRFQRLSCKIGQLVCLPRDFFQLSIHLLRVELDQSLSFQLWIDSRHGRDHTPVKSVRLGENPWPDVPENRISPKNRTARKQVDVINAGLRAARWTVWD